MPINNQVRILSELKPRKGKRNPYGSKSFLQTVFNYPGEVKTEFPADPYVTVMDVLVEKVYCSCRVGGSGVTLVMHGIPNFDGTISGSSFNDVVPEDPADPEIVEAGNAIYPEVVSASGSDEGLVVTVLMRIVE